MTKGKILKIITLALPLPIYLFLSAVLFNINPDVIINDVIADVSVVSYGDEYFISGDSETTYNGGYIIYYNGVIGAVIDSEDIVKIGDGYYSYVDSELTSIELIQMQQQQGYKIPITFFISLLGVFIVAMIVMGKMDILKTYPRTSVLIGLASGTLILFIIDVIVSNILGVFIVATITWAIYCLEYMFTTGKLTKADSEKSKSDLVKLLKEALDE